MQLSGGSDLSTNARVSNGEEGTSSAWQLATAVLREDWGRLPSNFQAGMFLAGLCQPVLGIGRILVR